MKTTLYFTIYQLLTSGWPISRNKVTPHVGHHNSEVSFSYFISHGIDWTQWMNVNIYLTGEWNIVDSLFIFIHSYKKSWRLQKSHHNSFLISVLESEGKIRLELVVVTGKGNVLTMAVWLAISWNGMIEGDGLSVSSTGSVLMTTFSMLLLGSIFLILWRRLTGIKVTDAEQRRRSPESGVGTSDTSAYC